MTSVSAGHIILTPTQPVGSGRSQRESNPGLLTRSRALYRLSYRAFLEVITALYCGWYQIALKVFREIRFLSQIWST